MKTFPVPHTILVPEGAGLKGACKMAIQIQFCLSVFVRLFLSKISSPGKKIILSQFMCTDVGAQKRQTLNYIKLCLIKMKGLASVCAWLSIQHLMYIMTCNFHYSNWQLGKLILQETKKLAQKLTFSKWVSQDLNLCGVVQGFDVINSSTEVQHRRETLPKIQSRHNAHPENLTLCCQAGFKGAVLNVKPHSGYHHPSIIFLQAPEIWSFPYYGK